MLQTHFSGLTTPIRLPANSSIRLKYAPLKHCQSLFSLSGRYIRVISEKNTPLVKGLVVANEIQKSDSSNIKLFFIATFKISVIALLTISVLGLVLVLIGAKVFSTGNPLIYEKNIRVIDKQSQSKEKAEQAGEEADKKEDVSLKQEKTLKEEQAKSQKNSELKTKIKEPSNTVHQKNVVSVGEAILTRETLLKNPRPKSKGIKNNKTVSNFKPMTGTNFFKLHTLPRFKKEFLRNFRSQFENTDKLVPTPLLNSVEMEILLTHLLLFLLLK